VIIIQSAAENRATIRFESQSDDIYEMRDWTAFHLNLTEASTHGIPDMTMFRPARNCWLRSRKSEWVSPLQTAPPNRCSAKQYIYIYLSFHKRFLPLCLSEPVLLNDRFHNRSRFVFKQKPFRTWLPAHAERPSMTLSFAYSLPGAPCTNNTSSVLDCKFLKRTREDHLPRQAQDKHTT
jgi:hypothetical protein